MTSAATSCPCACDHHGRDHQARDRRDHQARPGRRAARDRQDRGSGRRDRRDRSKRSRRPRRARRGSPCAVGRREDRPGRRRVWAREQAREREEKERRSRPPSSASPCRPTSSCTRGPRAVPRQAGQRWSGWSRSPRQYPSQPRSRLCPNPPALGNCRCCYSQVLAVAVSEPLWPVPGWISSLGRQGSPWLDRGGQPGPAEPTRYMLTPTVLASSDASGVGGLLKARRCRARTTRRDGSRHNFDRPRPRKRGILRIRLPSRSTRDPA